MVADWSIMRLSLMGDQITRFVESLHSLIHSLHKPDLSKRRVRYDLNTI